MVAPDGATPCDGSATRSGNGTEACDETATLDVNRKESTTNFPDEADACGGATVSDVGGSDACDATAALEGTDARGKPAAPDGDGRDEMPGIGTEVAAAMLRRMADNPGVGFRCLRRDTPMSVIWRWVRGAWPSRAYTTTEYAPRPPLRRREAIPIRSFYGHAYA